MPADAPVPAGLPDGLGRGPGETDALLLLRCLLGPTPRSLHALIWSREAPREPSPGSGPWRRSANDRTFLTNADVSAIRTGPRSCGRPVGRRGFDCAGVPAPGGSPIAVFVRGRGLDHGDDRVAVVGSRRPTSTGMESADLGRGLAVAGVVTVSGGAVGIDAAAHRGRARRRRRHGPLLLGWDRRRAHPASNRDTFQRIEASGTLLSEYPPGTPAEPFRFPARNRLIAALSRGSSVEGRRRAVRGSRPNVPSTWASMSSPCRGR